MQAVHFGAGNIGRGFIGETLATNGFSIDFVDVNSTIIDALNARHEYDIELAAEGHKKIHVANVDGLNNKDHPEAVVAAIEKTDLVTTAIGPKILPFIAPLIADGIKARLAAKSEAKLDAIACENMIGGSQFLKTEVYKHLNADEQKYADAYVGFPNAAVDRIVPIQHHEDPLAVSVEPFKEWVVDESQMKKPELKLDTVVYVPDLEPYIERKLFSVNTGHATVAYTGKYKGYTTIGDAIKDPEIWKQLQGALSETRDLLSHEFDFTVAELKEYQDKVASRFQNPYISDDISRVARTPIRKLGYDERFVRPMRELKAKGLDYSTLLDTVGMIFTYDEPKDDESVKLQQMLKDEDLTDVIKEVTGLKDADLISAIAKSYQGKLAAK
ncbi:mannitol-1-phosphate 5-dehydrogenase [Loigolactobacillus backii]|uniref:mannitol-1-phosphate 5-dehydrogenase n=1 Tax=Loigolactobacillus backii TaxID=375175 RepID=UPI000C1CACFE|nr:mannitol-1-phosphate 5-dehydrogenase [Loigolactobacillus backii]MDA5388424.1 mannitol-1-phosphate 5-dehydrogenase [Loigolactobacillus backii]MDA5390921.1 mannitol-1-phosphate 5-dehydrogenase [Loigolactobacillus backii]PIO84222.1 mannitol-1-phosphate 5-dehydrogenase [Loigolactobacillus backii]